MGERLKRRFRQCWHCKEQILATTMEIKRHWNVCRKTKSEVRRKVA